MPCQSASILLTVTTISLLLLQSPVFAIRSIPKTENKDDPRISSDYISQFDEAPIYRNGPECPIPELHNPEFAPTCKLNLIHIAMTIDTEYLRGTVAAIHSILKHTSCPENLFFHLIASDYNEPGPDTLTEVVKSVFPYLPFKIYPFDSETVKKLISNSLRPALDNPLNYARSYLSDILNPCISRVIYLDSDIIVVDEIRNLWSITLSGSKVIGAPEYCHVDLKKYFNNNFWSHSEFSKTFLGKRACYFNTGVMVMDLEKFRKGKFRERIEKWIEIQREQRIYELGSLPPFLLVFGGNIQYIEHRWNQHGLGGDNVVNSCRGLHPGPVSLLHWSGKGKPWVRLDAGEPCPVDYLWAPYDLIRPRVHHQVQR